MEARGAIALAAATVAPRHTLELRDWLSRTSLRLKGDYLAIVARIRTVIVVFLNNPAVGGARGYSVFPSSRVSSGFLLPVLTIVTFTTWSSAFGRA